MAFVSNNRFIPTNAYDVPNYTEAEIQDAQSRANVKNQENAIRSQNLLGTAYLYNKGMEAADKSPISDSIAKAFDKLFPGKDSSGVEVVDKSLTTAEIDAAKQANNITGVDPTTTTATTIDPTLGGKPMTGTEVTMGGVDPNAVSNLTNTASTGADLANAVNANANIAAGTGATTAGTTGATTAGTAGTAGAAGGASGLVSMLGPVAAIAILSKLFG